MRLKENADLIRFLEKGKECEHDVYFYTGEGDKLNLKSTLSQFLFSAVAAEDEMLKRGKVLCDDPEEYTKLAEFLEG